MTAQAKTTVGAAADAAAKTAEAVSENVACPFCGLVCDDLEVARGAGGTLSVTRNGCVKAVKGFERPVPSAEPTIGGKPATRTAAIAEAARLVREAKNPLLGGLGTDVDGMRAVMALADRAGATIDHALSEGQFRNVEVLQTSGWFMSTLTEVRNRADLVVIVGSDVQKLKPRFFERVVAVEEPMFLPPGKKRTVVFIGEGLDATGAKGGSIGDVITLACPLPAVAEVIGALRARLRGTPLAASSVAGIPVERIDDLAQRCRAAAYGVMVWAPPSLLYPGGDLTVRAVSDLVKDLNLTTRFAGLSLGGSEGATSAASVAAWQSGFPLRVSYAGGKPHHDPLRYSAQRLIASGEVDVLVWIASFSPDLLPPAGAVPDVLLAVPGHPAAARARVFIPVGTAGLDVEGRLIRCDSVVSLPLHQLRQIGLPSVADVVTAIEHAL